MAKADNKKQNTEPERPRQTATEPQAPSKGDGLAHDYAASEVEMPDDLQRNPGIGASKGATTAGVDADDLEKATSEADNTFKGDVENDAGRPGAGVEPKRVGLVSNQNALDATTNSEARP
jgi:hypothetical protein